MHIYNKISMNLQLFADSEKTEKPTPKKRKKAREEGQVFQSKEINSALLLIITFVSLKVFGKYMYSNLIKSTNLIFTEYINRPELFTLEEINIFLLKIIFIVVKIVAPIIVTAFIVGVIASYMQVGFLFTTKTLQVKFSRINPIEGFKRIFSIKSVVELVKCLIKVFLISYIIYVYASKQITNMFKLYDMNINSIVRCIGDMAFDIAIRAGGVLVALAILDYAYQRWDHEKNLKMSKQEVKQEYKQTEGDPHIKSKIKEKQRQIAMRRMMQDVPKADVIITNPTHYAIALKYDKEQHDAPYVVAKGKDLVAQNIKKVAKGNLVPIVEDKPLAQTLYKAVEIGQTIPEELYQSVAEVLAYVYSLNQ